MIERPVSECYNIRQNYNTYIGVWLLLETDEIQVNLEQECCDVRLIQQSRLKIWSDRYAWL